MGLWPWTSLGTFCKPQTLSGFEQIVGPTHVYAKVINFEMGHQNYQVESSTSLFPSMENVGANQELETNKDKYV